MHLSQVEIELFEQDGYLVLEEFVSKNACEALSHRATEIVKPGVVKHIEGNRFSLGEP